MLWRWCSCGIGFDIVSPFPHAPSLPTTTPGDISPASSDSRTSELADIFSRFLDLEVARLGSACGYWSAWFDRERSEMATSSTDDNAGASEVSPPKGDIRMRRPRIVSRRAHLERAVQGGAKGKGKKKCVDSGVRTELGAWEIGLEGEACEGWGCQDLEVSRSNVFVALGLCHGGRNVCDHAWRSSLCSVSFVARTLCLAPWPCWLLLWFRLHTCKCLIVPLSDFLDSGFESF